VTDDETAAASDADVGEVCVSGLQPGGNYVVNETSPPSGYGGAGEANVVVVGVAGGCSSAGLNAATFSNPPLADIQVNFRDGGSGEDERDDRMRPELRSSSRRIRRSRRMAGIRRKRMRISSPTRTSARWSSTPKAARARTSEGAGQAGPSIIRRYPTVSVVDAFSTMPRRF
jgi:hypothetical protein